MRKTWTEAQINAFMTELKARFQVHPRAPFSPTAIAAMKSTIEEEHWRSDSSIGKPTNWNAKMWAACDAHGIFKAEVVEVKVPMALHEIPGDLLFAELIRRFKMFEGEIHQEIMQPIRIELPPSPPRIRKPIVLIVGLNGSQIMTVEKALNGVNIALRFKSSSDTNNVMAAAKGAAKTLVMTKFIDHAVYSQLKKHQSRTLIHCNGGVTDAIRILKANFANNV